MSSIFDSMSNQKPLYALAVIAHPDDESFLLSGTCMKFTEEGKIVGVVCATRGEKGADRLNRELTEDQMADIRTKELHAACKIIGCSCVKFGHYPDGGLDKIDFEKLVADIVSEIEKYKPEIVLTFGPEGISGHKDHMVIGLAATAASKQAAHKIKELWLASIPASVIGRFNEHLNQRRVHHAHFHESELQGVPDNRLLKIDIRKYSQAKHDALKAHESQYLPHLTFDLFLETEYFEVIKLS